MLEQLRLPRLLTELKNEYTAFFKQYGSRRGMEGKKRLEWVNSEGRAELKATLGAQTRIFDVSTTQVNGACLYSNWVQLSPVTWI